jgi:hypothetical protein
VGNYFGLHRDRGWERSASVPRTEERCASNDESDDLGFWGVTASKNGFGIFGDTDSDDNGGEEEEDYDDEDGDVGEEICDDDTDEEDDDDHIDIIGHR